MNIIGSTILITGGGSGIGRGLAEALHKAGNQVIIAGRRQSVLDEVTKANPGMKSLALDIEKPEAIKTFAEKLIAQFPALNILINNAGMMKIEKVLGLKGDLSIAESTITTNLLGPIRLTAALLPHLLKQKKATIINVTSGLAFVPFVTAPSYSATKAGLHAYTVSLRYQLKDTPVEVLEIAPPYVQTELGGSQQASDPRAMPLPDYIAETMSLLKSNPKNGEIVSARAMALRTAERDGKYDELLTMLAGMVE
ncbi:MAG TPA: SDR family NAD(P)-dependent oxidoreductase [Tepidisphaeraceae bacterium]|jgi:uncharacterized oxidoreductase|nr:SDR family NAD(P)-dependent oxidoreductase [Tepidisphaeraceae bacterium]